MNSSNKNNIKRIIIKTLKLKSLFCFFIDFIESNKRLKRLNKNIKLLNLRTVSISVLDSAFNEFITAQTPDYEGIVGNTFFTTELRPDIQVVINKPNPFVPLWSKTGEKWLFHIEPPGYIKLLGMNNLKYLDRFTRVYTTDPDLYSKGGKFIASPPYVHWHLEISAYSKKNNSTYGYNFLENQKSPPLKNVNLTAINSNINNLPGHKIRASFIKQLCESGFDFELYGGSNWKQYPQYINNAPMGKWPIYSISRYVLVVENEVAPYYWTEKIADTLLCWSMPIYFGAPNIGEYLPQGSYINIDINNPNAIENLKQIVGSNFYENNIQNIAKARQLILKKLNLFSFLNDELNNVINKIG